MTHAAFEIADAVGGLDHFFGELGGLAKDRFEDIGRGVGETGQIAVPLVAQHIVQDEKRVLHRRLVCRHRLSSTHFQPFANCAQPSRDH